MAHETIDGTYRHTNLQNEPADYLSKREELRLAEIELMRQRERVAELRRGLPKGTIVQDYEFEEGPTDLNAGDKPTRTVRLSALFTGKIDPWWSTISCMGSGIPAHARCAPYGSTV